MSPENKAFLDENEHYFITLRDAGYMKGLSGNVRSGMVKAITEEFQPGYATDLWCGPCVADMVRLTYRYYYEWKERNPPAPVVDPLHTAKADLIKILTGPDRPTLPAFDSYTPDFTGDKVSTAQEDFSEPVIEPAPPKPTIQKANFPKHNNRRRR